MDMDLFQPDDIPSQEGERTLICSCPKCSARIELELAQIAEETASSNSCPACKARYVLTRESFARRASRKAGEINCANCGGPLDHSQYCPSCKALYPDYFAAEFPDAAKKRARQNRDIFGSLKNFSFEWRSSSAPSVDYQPVLMDSEPWQEPAGWKKKNIVRVASSVVIVALIALGISLYNHAKAKKQYVTSYTMALYAIKTGTDLGLSTCGKISTEWAAKGISGQNDPPLISVDDENLLNKVKDKTDAYLQQLNDPPTAFKESNEKILKLNGVFVKLHKAALKPTGSVTSFVEQTQKAGNDFKVATEDLKKTLPAELSAQLEKARAKYRVMKDF
jgi:hypothetical protein